MEGLKTGSATRRLALPKLPWPKLPWAVSAALIMAPVALFWSASIELYFFKHDKLLLRDFLNFWMGSRLFLEHRMTELFTPALYEQVMNGAFRDLPPYISFSYPPSALPLISWAGLLPVAPALALWSLLGLLALFVAAWPHSKNPWVAAAIFVSPAVLACLDAGQNGLFTSAIFVAALTRIDRRPIVAGALIGLLTVKPHLGLLLPIALIAARRWKAVASAGVSASVLVGVSLLLAGPEAWRLYLLKTAPYQGVLYQHVHRSWATMTPSPAIATVSAGGSWELAFVLQGVVTVAAAALVAVLFAGRARRPISELDKVVLLAATFLASPYSFNYDMAALAVCVLLANLARPELDRVAAWRSGSILLWSAPLIMVVVGVCGMFADRPWPPVGTLMLLAGLGLVLWASGKEAFAGSPPVSWAARLWARVAGRKPALSQ